MRLRQVEFFNVAYEQGSLSKAAAALYVTQQSVSKSIRQLEAELGHPLFERDSSGVHPTPAGDVLYEELRSIQDRLDALPVLLNDEMAMTREKLGVTVAYGVLGSLTAKIFDEFSKSHPRIELSLTDAQDLVVEEEVLAGRADLGIGVGPIDQTVFDATLLKRERMWLCVHRDNPLFNKEGLAMADLRGQRFLSMGPLFKSNEKLRHCCEGFGFEPDVVFEANEIVTLKEMCEANMGLFMVPTSKAYSTCPDVRFVPFPDEHFTYNLLLIHRKGRPLSHAGHDLAAFLRSRYASEADKLV